MSEKIDNSRNERARMDFVSRWAEYVRTHKDKEWSRQQNIIINSCLNSADMDKVVYLRVVSKRS